MPKVIDLLKLRDKFSPDKIEFRIGSTTADKTAGIALAYVTNRAIQDRLDDVCGPENWCNKFREWKGEHQLCGISIRIGDEWVTKWDGAENTRTEPLKGGLSGSMKRAASQWGIGRYLYDVPTMWVNIVPRGKSYEFVKPPTLPQEFLPKGCENKGYNADVASKETVELAETLNFGNDKISKEQSAQLAEIVIIYNIDISKIIKWARKSNPKIKELSELTVSQYRELLDIYSSQIPDFKIPAPKKKPDVSTKENERLQELNSRMGAKK